MNAGSRWRKTGRGESAGAYFGECVRRPGNARGMCDMHRLQKARARDRASSRTRASREKSAWLRFARGGTAFSLTDNDAITRSMHVRLSMIISARITVRTCDYARKCRPRVAILFLDDDNRPNTTYRNGRDGPLFPSKWAISAGRIKSARFR